MHKYWEHIIWVLLSLIISTSLTLAMAFNSSQERIVIACSITVAVDPVFSQVSGSCCFLSSSSSLQTSTTVNTPSYRCQNNRHIDCGPLNKRRRRVLAPQHYNQCSCLAVGNTLISWDDSKTGGTGLPPPYCLIAKWISQCYSDLHFSVAAK